MNQDHKRFASDGIVPAPASLDWPRLVATLSAHQASTRTAQVAMRLGGVDRPASAAADALADIIEGNRGWTAAATAMAGRFRCVETDDGSTQK